MLEPTAARVIMVLSFSLSTLHLPLQLRVCMVHLLGDRQTNTHTYTLQGTESCKVALKGSLHRADNINSFLLPFLCPTSLFILVTVSLLFPLPEALSPAVSVWPTVAHS